jgi:type IV pilus assembly protein PilE
MQSKENGFTLIEVMIVVVIVGILTAIAFPSYQDSVSKSRRSDAQGALQGLAQAMERNYTNEGTYAKADGDDDDEVTGAAAVPVIFATQSPLDGGTKYYNLRIDSADGTSYVVQAVPIAGGAQDGDGVLQLSSTGIRVWDRDNDSNLAETADACWRRVC